MKLIVFSTSTIPLVKLLLLYVTIAFSMTIDTSSEYTGSCSYSTHSPDGTVKGAMILVYEDGEYIGKITAYGQEYEMIDIELEDDELSFKTNTAGYGSAIKGAFSINKYLATISVKGMEIPMTAIGEGQPVLLT